MPFIALFKSDGSDTDRDALRNNLHQNVAKRIFEAKHAPATALAIVGIHEPSEMNLYREGNDFQPPYDLALKADYPDADAFIANLTESGLPRMFAVYGAYETIETVKKAPPASSTDKVGELPGVRMLHPLRFHADLPMSALLRSWRDIHGDLAPSAHSGAESYMQQLVTATLTPEAPAFGGFSEFQFPSREALVTKYFDSDAARTAVRHDIRHFIDGIPPRLFGTAYRYVMPTDK